MKKGDISTGCLGIVSVYLKRKEGWTKLGALHYYLPIGVDNHYHLEEVKSLTTQWGWNEELLQNEFTEEVYHHITQEVQVMEGIRDWDKPWWMQNSSGRFSVKSAWELIRQRQERLWKQRLPVGEILIRIGMAFKVHLYSCNKQLRYGGRLIVQIN
ncbi:hypothetical protein KY290_026657 [Solanum tuberosum]|uniref:Uncharacterized protein n=1 Tax=Solanum tuberosum TaxID=4113 RepID=A0ABQ7UX30_SOLTU|nr:hypothetical protein KY290_026657 [Solanum tuberosum]